MSYVVLARKYRPQKFEDLVGQMPVSQTLRNALESGRVSHAYIFSGPRGVGKTTTARVLAKCMNCVTGPTITPCDKCDSCISISQANSMGDVMEIDGASNRGIEQIRELRENAKYAPSKSRYRIYIIDEAHQITKDAFGALLKTLEEPPAHVVFMMATTEVHKIPGPILSRCQRFTLRPIAPDLVFDHLKLICKKEKIKVEDDALKNIVRFVEGSPRDALSLLDQAIVFSPKGITTDTLRQLLGLLPREVIVQFAKTLKEGDPATILKVTTENIKNGIDLTQLGKDLQTHYHLLMLTKAGVNDPLFIGGKEIKKEAEGYEFLSLERNIRLLARMLEEMRRSETPRAIFEITVLKIGQKILDARILLDRIEQLELQAPSNGNLAASTKVTPSFSKTPARPNGPVNQSPIGFTSPRPSQPPPPMVSIPQPTVSVRGHSDLKISLERNWKKFVNFVGTKKQMVAAALMESEFVVNDTTLEITFEKSFNQQLVDRSRDQLKSMIDEYFSAQVSIVTKVGALKVPIKRIAPIQPPQSSFTTPGAPQSNEPLYEELSAKDLGTDVQIALKHFPGVLKRRVTGE